MQGCRICCAERLLLTIISTSLPGCLCRRGKVSHCAGMLALLCRDRGRSLLIIVSTSLPGHLRRRGNVRTALRKDAGSTVQRSRKVATDHHEYVVALGILAQCALSMTQVPSSPCHSVCMILVPSATLHFLIKVSSLSLRMLEAGVGSVRS